MLYTDSVRALVLILGSAAITWFGLQQLGGWGELQAFAAANVADYALWRPLSDPEFPWLGILVASPIVGIWYWCTDQYIVQRTLAAKNLTAARRGALWGAFLKVWPMFIFLVPGLIGAALNDRGMLQIPVDAAGNLVGDQVFPTMVVSLLPAGLRGLVVAGLLAALMSSLSSLFNSTATLFTVDVYEKLRPDTSEQQIVNVGRLATGVVIVLGMCKLGLQAVFGSGEIENPAFLAVIDREAVRQSYDRKNIAATAVVLGLVAAVYLYFSFWV